MARNPAVLVSLLADWDGKDLAKAQREIQKLQDKSKSFGDKFRSVGESFKKTGEKMSRVGGALTKSVTLPIVGIGTAAVISATEFESSMAKITGLVGIAGDKVDGFRDDVLNLAGATGKAPKELADALFVVTSAGLRGESAINALDSAAKAGAAGLGDTADISRSVAGALNAYGEETLNAAQATDIIVAAARAGNFETSQFAGSIGKILPNAKAAGASFEDTSGAIALLTRTNGDAAKSVTLVDALFRKIATPTKQTQTLLAEAGLSAQDLRDSMAEQGLVGTLRMLDDAIGNDQEKLGLLIGSAEGTSAAMQILDADSQTLADTFGVVADSTGITDEAFGVVSETSAFKMNQAINKIKATLVEFGEILLPFVDKFSEVFSSLADRFRALTPEQQKMVVVIGGIAAAIGPVVLIAGKLIAAIGAIIVVFNPLTLKIALVVAAVAALAAGFVYLWNNSEKMRTTVINAFNTVRTAVLQVIDALKKKLKENEESLNTLREGFMKVVQFIADNVIPVVVTFYGTYLKTLIKVLGTLIGGIIDSIGWLVDLGVTFFNIGKKVVEFERKVREKIGEAVEIIKELPQTIIDLFKAAPTLLVQAGKDVIEGFLDGAGSILPSVGKFFLDKLPGWMVGPFKRALGIASPSKVFERLGEQVMEGLEKGINNKSDKAIERTKETAQELIETARAAIDEMEQYSASVQGSIVGLLDLGQAYEDYTARQQAVTDTLAELTQYQTEIQGEATDQQKAKLQELQGAYQDAQAAAASGAQSIVEEFIAQGERIRDFNNNLQTLLKAGLSKRAFDAIVAQGLERGADIAAALVEGNVAENARRVSEVYTSVSIMGEQTGNMAAGSFMAAGAKLAVDMLSSFIKEFLPSGKKRNELLQAVKNLNDSISFDTKYIDIVTRRYDAGGAPPSAPSAPSGPAPSAGYAGPAANAQVASQFSQQVLNNAARLNAAAAAGQDVTKLGFDKQDWANLAKLEAANIAALAAGGIVTGPTLALIGEAGPEAVVPLNRRNSGMGTTVNVTVNAGMGTDGAAVGRQIVDVLKQYEKRNGPLPVRVA